MNVTDRIARAAQVACLMEACAPKPGNVNRLHDFADLRFEDLLLSALAIGPAMASAGERPVGETVLHAIQDTHRLVNTNANLGMVLLFSPLVKAGYAAVLAGAPTSAFIDALRNQLAAILEGLTVEDARRVYAAIRLAKPGGMGQSPQADIHAEPAITLREAMTLAKDRDSVAAEYTSGFQITFEIGLPALKSATAEELDLPSAIVQTYLTILSRVPDTLIARKVGEACARDISRRAKDVIEKGGVKTIAGRTAIAGLDQNLRDANHHLNPGTSADLTAATIFLYLLE